jgi:hypothetical protein
VDIPGGRAFRSGQVAPAIDRMYPPSEVPGAPIRTWKKGTLEKSHHHRVSHDRPIGRSSKWMDT